MDLRPVHIYIFGMKGYLISTLLIFTLIRPAMADIIEVEPLSFGVFVMASNNASYQLTVSPMGMVSHDPQFHPITDPVPATFDIIGFPEDSELMVNIIFNDLVPGGIGESFSIISPVISPSPVVTDGTGRASFNVGATLQTSGNGGVYTDSGYSGSMTISVNF